jgi:hypothetical protein
MSGLTELEARVLVTEARFPDPPARTIWAWLGISRDSYYRTLAAILADPARLRAARVLHPATVARLEQRIAERGAQRSAWITGGT